MEAQTPLVQLLIPILTAAVGLLSGVVLQMVKSKQELLTQQEKARLDLLAQQEKSRLDLLTVHEKDKVERQKEVERERAATRLNYLDPLLVSARDYEERLEEIQRKVESEKDKLWMADQFHQVKENPRLTLIDHISWCNGEGNFAVSTNYLTAVYLFHINKIRREFPKSALSPSEAQTLFDDVDRVRRALGGEKGIWETLQDSAGEYMRFEVGTLLSYRRFCEQIFKTEERAWILRLLDFYREIHQRTDEERKRMSESLKGLIHSIESIGR
jgi:hypothetical protein